MVDRLAIRINAKAYLYRAGVGGDVRLWVSQQSLLPILPSTHAVLLTKQFTYEPYSVNDYTRVPILCDRALYTGRAVAKLTHNPTKRTIVLYPSIEWLDFLHSHTPIIIHHNDRYWVYTEYDPDAVYLYKNSGGKWDNTYRCWVFRELPSTSPLETTPIYPLESLLNPVYKQTNTFSYPPLEPRAEKRNTTHL